MLQNAQLVPLYHESYSEEPGEEKGAFFSDKSTKLKLQQYTDTASFFLLLWLLKVLNDLSKALCKLLLLDFMTPDNNTLGNKIAPVILNELS